MANQKALDFVANSLKDRAARDFEFTGLQAVLGALNPGQQNRMLKAVRSNNAQGLGELILAFVNLELDKQTRASAAAFLADDALSSAELNEIFR